MAYYDDQVTALRQVLEMYGGGGDLGTQIAQLYAQMQRSPGHLAGKASARRVGQGVYRRTASGVKRMGGAGSSGMANASMSLGRSAGAMYGLNQDASLLPLVAQLIGQDRGQARQGASYAGQSLRFKDPNMPGFWERMGGNLLGAAGAVLPMMFPPAGAAMAGVKAIGGRGAASKNTSRINYDTYTGRGFKPGYRGV
jgi:hypothetical protein